MKKPRKVAPLYVLGAVVCVGAIWPMWAAVVASGKNIPPSADGPAMAVMSVFFVSLLLVVAASALVVAAIRRLRRK